MAKKGRPRKKITIEDITKEITENGLTVQKIAEKYKVSEDTIQRRMKEASNAAKSTGRRPEADDEEPEIDLNAEPAEVEELPTSRSLRDQIHALLQDGQNVSQIARELKISRRTVGRYRDQAPSAAPAGKPGASQPNGFDETAGNKRTIYLRKTEISSLEELIAKYDIDEQVWECTRFRVNEWEMASMPRATGSDSNGWERDSTEPIVTRLYQIRADFTRKVNVEAAKREVDKLREEAENYSPTFQIVRPRLFTKSSGNRAEISMFDHHFGALAWGEETGWEDYDLNIAKAAWDKALAALCGAVDPYRPEAAVLVLGNDQQNADNRAGTTERGTFQSMDSRYQKVFSVSRDSSRYAIDCLLGEFGCVEVILVPGNHDPLSAWHLGDTLNAWYRNCSQVRIDNAPRHRKWWEFGVNMIMFTHGNAGKLERYPGIMAAEQPEMWGRTKWREAHTGDKHHRHLVELPGAAVRILPSLRPPCAWSSENQFVGSIRAAEAYVWNHDEGLIGTAVHSVLPQQRAA